MKAETIEIAENDLLELTPDKVQEYVNEGGRQCPHCKSTHLEHDSVTIDGMFALQEVWCTACDNEWMDKYKLVGIVEG